MNSSMRVRIPLNPTPEQHQRLTALQAMFARACNELAPLVQTTKTWNRVALHHMAYKKLRDQFPSLGSQMACNAIYSVSRTSRLVFQHPHSPFNLQRLGNKPLPLLRFTDNAPVYFDRHTLSLKDDQLSLYTLDGRIRFQLSLGTAQRALFVQHKLREVVLNRQHPSGSFELCFDFRPTDDTDPPSAPAPEVRPTTRLIPEYLTVEASA